jgi:hypothetical protein
MKIAVAPDLSMARVLALLLVPLTITKKRRCKKNRSTVYTVQEEIESNIMGGPLFDGVFKTTGLNNIALL